MAAPTPTTRVVPAGVYLKNGYRALITFALDPNISLWEIAVTPSGDDGGDAIDITTQWNDDFRTKAPQDLSEQTEASFTFAYDPVVRSQIAALINRATTITERYPDGSTLAYYGYLKSVEFDAMENGTMPMGTATIQPTNYDPTNRVEAAPVMTEVAGT